MNGETITHWSVAAIEQLRDTQRCPLCRAADLRDAQCPACGAVLAGESGVAVWKASLRAAEALGELREVLDRAPREPYRDAGATSASLEAPHPDFASTATPQSSPAATLPASEPLPSIPPPARASTTLQSVLAVAGAGLVATAAIIFTFLNPDLTDPAARGAIVAVAAVLFAVAAPALLRATLRFSAESVATLAVVFGSLGAAVLGQLLAPTIDAWPYAASSALLGGTVLLALGLLTRLRVWMLAASITLPLVPALASVAMGGEGAPVLGALGTATVALLLLEGRAPSIRRMSSSLAAERGTLMAILLIALAVMTGALPTLGGETPVRWLAMGAALLAAALLLAASAAHGARRIVSTLAGVSATAAAAVAALAVTTGPIDSSPAWLVALPAGAAVALLVLAMTLGARTRARRRSVLAGSLATLIALIVPHGVLAGVGALATVIGSPSLGQTALGADSGVAVVGGLVVVSAALAGYAVVLRVRVPRVRRPSRAILGASLALIACAGLGALGLPAVPVETRIIAGLLLLVGASLVLSATSLGRRSDALLRLPIVLGMHAALVMIVAHSWASVDLGVISGPPVLIALVAVAGCVPRTLRPGHVGVGTAYALIVIAAWLGMRGLSTPAGISITATVGLLAAIAATLLPRLPASWWIAVLIVTTVPFALAVGLVAIERSGWSALSTTTMLVLAICLLSTRRSGLGLVVRTLAAAVIVPAIAVVLVDLGAILLISSGSPVVLPLIALVIATVMVGLDAIHRVLQRRGMPPQHARAAVTALEAAALLTAVIAIGLSIDRPAAGPGTALVVLAVLAVGWIAAGAVTDSAARSLRSWWLGGAAATGAVWAQWALLGVDSLEAYVLPPTLGAAIVGAVLTVRGRPEPELVGAGLLTAIAPIVGALALGSDPAPLRTIGLVVSAIALVVLTASIPHHGEARRGRAAPLRATLLMAAIVASSAAAVHGLRLGLGIDVTPMADGTLMLAVIAVALGGAIPAGVAGWILAAESPRASLSRFALVPALMILFVPAWSAVSMDPDAYGALWMLMLALLALMVNAAARQQHSDTLLPPVWLLFGLALITAIVAWSPRELRVEWFSLPLGLLLLAAGAIALRGSRTDSGGPLHHWPSGRTGSWALLAPGLLVLVLASMLATATDPQTWRAVLVMALALAFILVGVRWRLAAPFVLGIIVLPLENVLAFSVQIGRGIEAMPWWITLAVVGIVLLVIAVGSERGVTENGARTARLRDLR